MRDCRRLIPTLAKAELSQLEENLKRDGCRDPLVIWNGKNILLDGHHRFEICRRNQIPYKTERLTLPDRDAAKAWIIRNQFGRRNLAPFVRAELALKLEPLIAIKAKERMRAGKPVQNSAQGKTRDVIAKAAGLSHDTIHKAKVVAEKAPEEVKAKLRSGESSINAAYSAIQREEKAATRTEQEQARLATIPKDNCILIHGDLRTELPKIKDADALITDPPYSKDHLHLYGDLARYAAGSLKDGGSLLVMTGQSYIPEILALMTPHIRYHWMISYLTPGGQSVQLWQRNVNTFWKPVLWFVKGDYKGKWAGDVTKSATNDNDKRFHEWGQSESGMADLIERFTEVGDMGCRSIHGRRDYGRRCDHFESAVRWH